MNTPSLNIYSLYGFSPRHTYYPTDPQYAAVSGLVERSPSLIAAEEISSYAVIAGIGILVAIRILQEIYK